MEINERFEKLQSTFPKLTEGNQQYVLGLAEGLKTAQSGRPAEQQKMVKVGSGKQVK